LIASVTLTDHGTNPLACPPGIDPVTDGEEGAGRPSPSRARSTYLALLTGAFTVFNSVRILAYLPTLWAIHATGDSSQHSLWTWLTWMGANATMAAWLFENNGQRLSRAVVINACNAVMCIMTVVLIVGHRL
jgi:hypothetical protein